MIRRRKFWLTVCTSLFAIGAMIGITAKGVNAEAGAQENQLEQDINLVAVPSTQAPSFTLTDENGVKIALRDLRGKVVVLEFMDPKCTDVCPITSTELVDASHDLGTKNLNVEFIGVNVNTYHRTNADLAAFSREHGLSKLPNWHFVSGTPEQLAKVWQAYGVYVKQNPTGDVIHSDYLYFIDETGQERYIAASSTDSKTPISEWGHGIAYFAQKLM